MRCEIHRREYGVFEECAECQETGRLQEEHQKFIKDLHEQQRSAAEQAHEELEAEKERRHQEILDLQRERAEAEDQRHEQIAEREQERLQAEEGWREEQRRRESRREVQRELREGLPSFDAAFQKEWLTVNQAMAEVWDEERSRRERIQRLRQAVDAHSQERRAAIFDLQLSLLGQRVDAVVVEPPAAARKAWQQFVRAHRRLAHSIGFRHGAGWQVDMSKPNLMAPWHLLTRMAIAHEGLATANAVRRLGLAAAVPELPPQPSLKLLACGAFVFFAVLDRSARGIEYLRQGDGAPLLGHTYFFAVTVSFLLVLTWRLYASTVLPNGIHRRLTNLQSSVGGLLKALHPKFGGVVGVLDRRQLFSYPEMTLHNAFTPLLVRLEEFLDQNANYSRIRSDDETTRELGERVSRASGKLSTAIAEKANLERFTDPPEATTLKSRYEFMDTELRRVGQQIMAGLRVRSAVVRLVRCPACAGPVSSETSSCPYCGSAFRYA